MTAIVRGDAFAIPLRDESVDLIVTSPPYFGQRSYRDGGEHYDGQIGSEPHPQAFLEALWAVTAECWRVLKPTGSMFVNLGDKRSGSGAPGTTSGFEKRGMAPDSRVLPSRSHTSGSAVGSTLEGTKQQGARSGLTAYPKAAFGRSKSKQLLPHRYAIGCEDGLADPDGIGWIMRQDLVWAKPNGMPESVRDRTRDAHEYWFHLCKLGDYYADIDEIRGAVSDYSRPNRVIRTRAPGQRGRSFDDTVNPAGALPSSVWSISTQPLSVPEHLGIEHFAAFPPEWPRRLILAFCPPGGIVLDPMGGSGTTAMAARALDRTGISLDLSTDYCRLARWRVFDSPGAGKVADRTAGERQGALL